MIMPGPQHSQPLGHEGAVRLFERHHVADRGERHEIEQAEQVGFGRAAVEALAAQRARGRHQKQEHDAGGGEMALTREIVLPVGIEHGIGRRQSLVGLVVVDDDDFGAGLVGGGDGGLCRGAAIDREDEPRAVFAPRPASASGRRAVAFGEPVGNISRHALPMGAQEALDQRHGGRAVDVVVAEHGDRLVGPYGGGKARGRLLHVLEARGVRQQRLERAGSR